MARLRDAIVRDNTIFAVWKFGDSHVLYPSHFVAMATFIPYKHRQHSGVITNLRCVVLATACVIAHMGAVAAMYMMLRL